MGWQLNLLKRSTYTLADIAVIWIIFFSLVYQKLVPIGFILWLIFWIKDSKKEALKIVISNSFSGIGKWFIFYYLLLCLGLLWTQNYSFAFSKLENKLAFLLLPIFMANSRLSISIKAIQQLFVWSTICALSCLEFYAAYRWLYFKSSNAIAYFFEPYFTVLMHRSYLASYLVIASIFTFEKYKQDAKFSQLLVLLFLAFGVLQTGSKTGLIAIVIVGVIYLITALSAKQNLKTNLMLLSFIVIIVAISAFNQKINSRFTAMKNALVQHQTTHNANIESNSTRLIMWKASWEVWKENPLLGVGTGDYNDALINYNRQQHNDGVVEKEFNSHNQFLNTGVQLGIIGLLCLFAIFITGYLNEPSLLWKKLLLLVFFINFLVESFLETQAGIILFCLLLLFIFPAQKKITFDS